MIPSLAAEWQSFAAMAFPDAPAELLTHLETAFYSGTKALTRLQGAMAEACATGQLSDDDALVAMKTIDAEIEAFGARRGAELRSSMEHDGPREPAPDMSEAAQQEKLDAIGIYYRALQETLAPLVAGKGKIGLVALRVFFTVRDKDGTLSGGHSGLTADSMQGERLKAEIPQLLLGRPDFSGNFAIKQPRKS